MIRYFVNHPTAANLLMVLFLLTGLMAAPTLLRETFPKAPPNEVEISVVHPGARPEDVESAICERIESALDAVTDIERHSCEAREGLARAVVTMREGADFQRFSADIRAEIDAIDDFPDRADPPRIRSLGLTEFVASVALTGPESRSELQKLAEELRTRMLRSGDIPRVEIRGFATSELRIALQLEALRRHGLSVSDVARIIGASSVDLPAGSIETRDETLLIRIAEERRSAEELADLVLIATPDGGRVRLGEIATVSRRFVHDNDRIMFDGRPAAILDVSKTRAEDSLDVIDALKEFVARERARLPKDVGLEIVSDGASVVRDRLKLVVVNGVQGLALVFLVLWLFFGLRFSFWVAMGLPVSLAGGIALMALVGYSLNLMTTLGLLVVIGLLMDDAIVIAENIARKREQGLSPVEAAIEGARQVFPNVLASFLTTAMVFGSLAFLAGDLGVVLRVVPVVMLFVLTVSLIEAFLILPHHLLHSLEVSRKEGGMRQRVDRAMEFLRRRLVGPLVDLGIRWRYVVSGLTLAALLVSAAMLAGGWLKFTAFPELDGDTVVARVLLPQSTPAARTEEVVARLVDGIWQVNEEMSPDQPGGADLIRHVTVFYGVNRDAFESGAHVATVSVDLLPSTIRSVRPDEVLARWRAVVGPIPDVIALKYDEPTIGPAGIDIDMRLKGDDLTRLKAASTELQDWLWRYRGVTSVMDDLRPGKRELRITLTDAAGPMGITAAMIADQLRAAYSGLTSDQLQIDGQRVEVNAILDDSDRTTLRRFDDFRITLADGSEVPLSLVADVEIGRGNARINHENGQRTVTVQGVIDTRIANASAIVSDTLARFVPDLLSRFPDLTLEVEGQRAEARKTQKSMLTGFAIGLVGVFLLLSLQFRSYLEPIVVMLIIPFSLIGPIWGHMAMGLDFSMPSMLGFVALAGVVVNNSILLVDFVKHEHGSARTVAEAAARAARARFRAILLTTLTTFAGLIPILTETSLQAQILIPLVTSLAFGLLAAALIVLFVLPGMYAILDDMGLSSLARQRRQGHRPASPTGTRPPDNRL